jgi:3-hydroxyisobutyrate dehydrogenase-like beta-hydroxyacid dehydrogenase
LKVAILGTGKMGAAMAKRLDETGHELHLWNRTAARARAIGVGRVHEQAPAAVAASELVITVLTGPAAVRSVYAELEADRDRVYLEMSTAGPEVPEELTARFPRLIACPVLAAPAAVEAGRALLLVAGDSSAIEAAHPVLESLGDYRRVPTHRRAAQLKLLNNAMLAANLAVAAELVTAAVKEGVTPDEAFEFMKRHAPYLEMRKSGFVGGPYEPLTFFLKDMVKDLDLALAEFDGADFPMPILDAVRAAFAEVMETHGEQEVSAVLERYRRRAATA